MLLRYVVLDLGVLYSMYICIATDSYPGAIV